MAKIVVYQYWILELNVSTVESCFFVFSSFPSLVSHNVGLLLNEIFLLKNPPAVHLRAGIFSFSKEVLSIAFSLFAILFVYRHFEVKAKENKKKSEQQRNNFAAENCPQAPSYTCHDVQNCSV